MTTTGSLEPLTTRSGPIAFADHVCLFLDCQTTGASPSNGNLLELAWRAGNASGTVSRKLNSHLVRQPDDEPVPFRIQSITGITEEEMSGAVAPAVLLEKLIESVEEMSEPRLCIVHYARFETPFIAALLSEYGKFDEPPFQLICTFEIARRFYPNLPSRGIRALGGFLGIEMDEGKRAHNHVEATEAIWKHLVERLNESEICTVEKLEQFLASPAVARRKKLEYPVERLKRLELPSAPGVYRMLSRSGRVLYVGKATSLKSRVNSHFRGRKNKSTKSLELLTQVADFNVTECGSPLEAALLEADEIKRFDPPYNISLKARQRQLLYFSRQLDSVSDQPDYMHCIGPIPNVKAIDCVLRLSETIRSGIADPFILFNSVELEDLMAGIDVFVERHSLAIGEAISPRQLLALGMHLFRSTKRLMRTAISQQAVEEEAIGSGSEIADRLSEIVELGDTIAEAGELEDEFFDENEELTPEDIADRLESVLIGVARSYLVAKEMTGLLNSNVTYRYKGKEKELFVRGGRIFLDPEITVLLSSYRMENGVNNGDTTTGEPGEKAVGERRPSRFYEWLGLDVVDFDRIRVLLTEIVKMMIADQEVMIEPSIAILSRW